MELVETDVMRDATELRRPGSGLHPSHFAALRTEILRTAADLSDAQLLDLADAFDRVRRPRRPGGSIRRHDAWIGNPTRALP